VISEKHLDTFWASRPAAAMREVLDSVLRCLSGKNRKPKRGKKAPTFIQRLRMKVGAFCISGAGDKLRNEQFGYSLASEPEGIQWEQAVPVAHDLACKV